MDQPNKQKRSFSYKEGQPTPSPSSTHPPPPPHKRDILATLKQTPISSPSPRPPNTRSRVPILEVDLPPQSRIPNPQELRRYILENTSPTISLGLVTPENILYFYSIITQYPDYNPYDLLEHCLSSHDPWNCNPSRPLCLPPVHLDKLNIDAENNPIGVSSYKHRKSVQQQPWHLNFETTENNNGGGEMSNNNTNKTIAQHSAAAAAAAASPSSSILAPRPSKAVTIIDPETGQPSFILKAYQAPSESNGGHGGGGRRQSSLLENQLRDRSVSNAGENNTTVGAEPGAATNVANPGGGHQRAESGATRISSIGSSSSVPTTLPNTSRRQGHKQWPSIGTPGEDIVGANKPKSAGVVGGIASGTGKLPQKMDQSSPQQLQPQMNQAGGNILNAGSPSFYPPFSSGANFARFGPIPPPPGFSFGNSPQTMANIIQGGLGPAGEHGGNTDNNVTNNIAGTGLGIGGGFPQPQHQQPFPGMVGGFGSGGSGNNMSNNTTPGGGFFPNMLSPLANNFSQASLEPSLAMQILAGVNRLTGVCMQMYETVHGISDRVKAMEGRIQVLEGNIDSVNTSFTLLQSTQDKLEARSAQNEEQQRRILNLQHDANRHIVQVSQQAESVGESQVKLGHGFGELHDKLVEDSKGIKADVGFLHTKIDVAVRNHFELAKDLALLEMRQYNTQSSLDQIIHDLRKSQGLDTKDTEHFESGAQRRHRITTTAEFLNSDPSTGEVHGSKLAEPLKGDKLANENYPAAHHYDDETVGQMMDLAFRHGTIDDEYAEYEDNSDISSSGTVKAPGPAEKSPPSPQGDDVKSEETTTAAVKESTANEDDSKALIQDSKGIVAPSSPETPAVIESVFVSAPASVTASGEDTAEEAAPAPILRAVNHSGRNSRQNSIRARKNTTARAPLKRI